jgi:hypothetical protein
MHMAEEKVGAETIGTRSFILLSRRLSSDSASCVASAEDVFAHDKPIPTSKNLKATVLLP